MGACAQEQGQGQGLMGKRIVKEAGKLSWQMWKDAEKDGKTMHCSTGEKGLAGMAFRDIHEKEKPYQPGRPKNKRYYCNYLNQCLWK